MSDIDSFEPNGDTSTLSFLNPHHIKSEDELKNEREARYREFIDRNQNFDTDSTGLKTLATASDGSMSLLRADTGHGFIYFLKDEATSRLIRYKDDEEILVPGLEDNLEHVIKDTQELNTSLVSTKLDKHNTGSLIYPSQPPQTTEEHALMDKPLPDYLQEASPEEIATYIEEQEAKRETRRELNAQKEKFRKDRDKAIQSGRWQNVIYDPYLTTEEAVAILEKKKELEEKWEVTKVLQIARNAVSDLEAEKQRGILAGYLKKSQQIIDVAKKLKRWDLVNFMPELELHEALEILERKNESPYSTWGSSEDIEEQRKQELETGEFGRLSDPEITPEHILTVINKGKYFRSFEKE